MTFLLRPAAALSLILSGALFGFFYAWICSTMWGLDAADPRVAITAMQAMNASVRNFVFAPAFFGTPFVAALAALLLLWAGQKRSAAAFAASAVVYGVLGMGLTMAVNVPMNEALALTPVPQDLEQAAEIWREYSASWQVWNQVRTVTSGLAFLVSVIGLLTLDRPDAA